MHGVLRPRSRDDCAVDEAVAENAFDEMKTAGGGEVARDGLGGGRRSSAFCVRSFDFEEPRLG